VVTDASPHLPLTVHREAGVIVASGELDLLGGPVLDGAMSAAQMNGDPLAIDCSRITFIDSSGLRSLVTASMRSADIGHRVRLVSPPLSLRRLLEITATASMFDVEPAIAEPDGRRSE